jgi:hypothetical protein
VKGYRFMGIRSILGTIWASTSRLEFKLPDLQIYLHLIRVSVAGSWFDRSYYSVGGSLIGYVAQETMFGI